MRQYADSIVHAPVRRQHYACTFLQTTVHLRLSENALRMLQLQNATRHVLF